MIGKPLGDFILLKPEEKKESQTASGIIIPATVASSNRGEIIAISEEIKEPGCSVGDMILFSSYSKDELEIEGVKYLLMPIKDAKFILNNV